MASLKALAGQTVWYGLSNIASKLLNFLLTPFFTYVLHTPRQQADYGDFTVLYSAISLANVLFTYGMETAYFRFAASGEDRDRLFQTSFGSLLISTILLSGIFILFSGPLCELLGVAGHPEYIRISVAIVAVDTMAAIPFARLRQAGRPRRYAFTRMLGIIVTVALTVIFIYLSPDWVAKHPNSFYTGWFKGQTRPSLILLANLAGSMVSLLLLWREWSDFRFHFDAALWGRILAYSAPFIIIGLGGMVNETMDRIMLRHLYPVDELAARREVAVYSANYRIAIFITLFIQAFRMAAEPFFFNQSGDKNAPKTYARVMKWFVITLCFAFLFTALFLDVWQYLVGKEYRRGLGVVPILLYANLALGIYYNLAVWYKISNKLGWGIFITLFGAGITLFINFALIPRWGMWACAWATAICYICMMIMSYLAGQKYFPVPYATKKLLSYIGVITVLFLVQLGITRNTSSFVLHLVTGSALMLTFMALVWKVERAELKSFPIIGRFA